MGSRHACQLGLSIIAFLFAVHSLLPDLTSDGAEHVTSDGVEYVMSESAQYSRALVLDKSQYGLDTNEELTSFLQSIDLGWERNPEEWMLELCPEVVEHFESFPYFLSSEENPIKNVTMFPTYQAARAVCTMKAVRDLAASLGTHAYIHAGSQLGALMHGGPVPWDDDIDMIMDKKFMDKLFDKCKNGIAVHPEVELKCAKLFNAFKLWLQPKDMSGLTGPHEQGHCSPFVDLFMFIISEPSAAYPEPMLVEVMLNGQWHPSVRIPIQDFYPTEPHYFGGLTFLGPKRSVASNRYDFSKCYVGDWNHKYEKRMPSWPNGSRIDCKSMYNKGLPQVTNDVLSNGKVERALFPSQIADIEDIVTSRTSAQQRDQWSQAPNTDGQQLTDALPHLNSVEVDNSIASQLGCGGKGVLRVVEYNAARGRWWMEASTLQVLHDADVIILNEMDIGMARSDQQHTTRQMAHYLGMNYAWGLEFVELTLGDSGDRASTPSNLPNFHGLHGNAILTRCGNFEDTTIFRDRIGEYFDDKANRVNAEGLEKRLGGRMAMLGRLRINGEFVIVGSIHKLDGYEDDIKDYIGASKAVIAGDEQASFCGSVGLTGGGASGNTWPANCQSRGKHRGDIICSNMKEMEIGGQETTLPCVVDNFGLSIPIGDHALVQGTFMLS